MWKPAFYSLLISIFLCSLAWDLFLSHGTISDKIDGVYSRAILIVLIIIGFATCLFCALKGYFCSHRYRIVNLVIFTVAIMPFLGAVYAGGWMLSTGYQFAYESAVKDMALIEHLSSAALGSDDVDYRKRSASGAFALYGIRLVYRDHAGNAVCYNPTEKERLSFERQQPDDGQLDAAVFQIRQRLERAPTNMFMIASMAAGCFLILMAVNLIGTSMPPEQTEN